MNALFKMQCVGCKATRTLTAEEAEAVVDISYCPKCGMPEVLIAIHVKP